MDSDALQLSELTIIMRVFAALSVYGLLGVIAVGFALYVVARWRAQRDAVVDSQLGLKLALGFFALVAFQLVLLGLALLVYAALSGERGDAKGELYRTAFGLLVPGAIVLGTHLAMLRRTNQAMFPGVRRLVLGFNLVVTGMIAFVGLVLAFQAVFKRGSAGEEGRIAGAMTLVYGGAWATLGWQFGRAVLAGYAPPSAMPDVVLPSSPAESQPTLPKLGGGSFPPLDPR